RRHGDPAGAAGLYRRALTLKPQSVEALTGLGGALCETGGFAEALPHLTEAQKLRPDDPGPLTLLGNALAALRRPAAAECFERALRLRPDFVPALAALGDWYRRGSRPERAVEYFERAAAAEPASPQRQLALGDALIAAGRYDEAEACLLPLAVVEPGFVPGHVLLARLLRVLGRFDDSLDSLTRALAVAPDDPDVLVALAEHHGAGLPDDLLDRLRAAADRTGGRAGGRGAVTTRFALAKVLDARGSHRAAFAEFVRANETRRAALARAGRIYDPARQERDIDRLIAVFTPEFFAGAQAGAAGFRSELPVFVTGMPRSGTTLVEQILASHSAVHAAGELRLVADITALLPDLAGSHADGGEAPLYPECLVPPPADRLRRLAEDHVDRLAALAQAAGRAAARRVVDKQPLNFLHLGLIALLWPQARIIHCRRDPRDTLLSCYTQSFETHYAWCWDQDSLAHFHRQHDRLMDHWRRVLPVPILEIEYETLVADFTGEARRLVESTGLVWEESCADFHRTDRPVATASVFQVRRPIYASAVGRWRRYETELQPLIEGLGDAASHNGK
ncbi:MAG: tetratricopeptide repeat-containing sulfotransferase family protein, partial [Rhodanobacter sp.]